MCVSSACRAVEGDEGPVLPVDEEVDHRGDEVDERDGKPDGQGGEHHEVRPHGVLFLALGDLLGLGKADGGEASSVLMGSLLVG